MVSFFSKILFYLSSILTFFQNYIFSTFQNFFSKLFSHTTRHKIVTQTLTEERRVFNGINPAHETSKRCVVEFLLRMITCHLLCPSFSTHSLLPAMVWSPTHCMTHLLESRKQSSVFLCSLTGSETHRSVLRENWTKLQPKLRRQILFLLFRNTVINRDFNSHCWLNQSKFL